MKVIGNRAVSVRAARYGPARAAGCQRPLGPPGPDRARVRRHGRRRALAVDPGLPPPPAAHRASSSGSSARSGRSSPPRGRTGGSISTSGSSTRSSSAARTSSTNRDFLLSLPPSLVYHASQLWIAYDKQDLDQWRWHLRRLIEDKELAGALSTKESRHALERWDHFAKDGPTAEKAAAHRTAGPREVTREATRRAASSRAARRVRPSRRPRAAAPPLRPHRAGPRRARPPRRRGAPR